jgi:NAD(P)-dependent dehydrogenase (short-subunit alcohol dehydrogenase family)
MRFKDKVALITAVGSGIGRATADIMAAEGAVIIGVDNDERRLAMAMEAMTMSGGRAIGRPANALDESGNRCRRLGCEAVRHDRHPGERGRRQHDHRKARRRTG